MTAATSQKLALRAELSQLKRWSENQFMDKHCDFAARKRDGFIRECHGDMHLGNMFRDRNSITFFDGIEFNEAFRWIDVLNEIAFLVMDLKYRGRADLAHRFLNTYLEHTGDYRGLVVLPFYLVYRALVRAKVKDIRSRQPQLAAQGRNALRDQVRDYLDLAGQCIVNRDRGNADASEADLKVLTRQLQTQQPLASDEKGDVISFDTECIDSHRARSSFAFDSERSQYSS